MGAAFSPRLPAARLTAPFTSNGMPCSFSTVPRLTSRWYSMRTTRTYLISSMGPLPTVVVTKQAGCRQAPPARLLPSHVVRRRSPMAWTSLTLAPEPHLHLHPPQQVHLC